MSILLEALKKSERQRQLGQTPTLQTSIESQPPSQLSLNHWLPISLMVLSVCSMAWFGLQQFRKPETVLAAEVPVAVAPATVAQTTQEQRSRTPTETFESGGGNQEQPIVPPAPETFAKGAEERARLNQSFNDFTADNDTGETVASASDPASVASAATELSKASLVAPEPEPEPEPEAPAVRTRQSTAQPTPSKVEPHIAEPISYWELPQGVRDDMPETKITVLVYSETPDERFLLVNGQRVVEKEELDSGLVLDEIRRDGAVFLYRKYRFLVKG